MFNPNLKQLISQGVYIAVLIALAIFLYQLGSKPWLLAAGHWPTLLVIMAATGSGIVVQAASFRKSYPAGKIPLSIIETSRIWAASAVISVVAPVFAGLATRTTLLIKAGTPLTTCILASTRQLWMGLEYSALIGGVAIFFVDIPSAGYLSVVLLLLWGLMTIARQLAVTKGDGDDSIGDSNRFTVSLRSSYPQSAHIWFVLQLVLMSTVFYVAFQGVGANLHWDEAFTLSAITVFISLIAFVPNGLGITDAVWIVVAMQTGLTLESSVSLAILIRIGHLTSALLIYLALRVTCTD